MNYSYFINQLSCCSSGAELKQIADDMITAFWFNKSITQDEYLKITAVYCETWKSLF